LNGSPTWRKKSASSTQTLTWIDGSPGLELDRLLGLRLGCR
jgi:hypothetical protein